LPIMDGKISVPGMQIPIIKITEDGTAIVVTDKGNVTIGNVKDVIANKNGTVTIDESNGTQLLEKGTLTFQNGTDIVDARQSKKGKASAKSGTKALLIVVTLLAVVWPLGNRQ